MKKIIIFFISIFMLQQALSAASSLEITGAWVREAPPGMKMLAAYMVLKNSSDKDITLKEVASPQFDSVEMHRTEIEDGRSRMVKQDSILVKAGSSFLLSPGGYHLMLMGPKAELKEGDSVEFRLSFSDGGELSLAAPVKKDTGGGMHHMEHSH
ncbi:MAG: copper chaperone PCu(A)C [Nitrospirae bacterium]|nr:copper chaperone PCu(A)C [Nitrospirota bacterium]